MSNVTARLAGRGTRRCVAAADGEGDGKTRNVDGERVVVVLPTLVGFSGDELHHGAKLPRPRRRSHTQTACLSSDWMVDRRA
jgi:hypothetical protein